MTRPGATGAEALRLTLPPSLERAVATRLARLEAERFPHRLWSRDATLWGADPERQRVAAGRLGWLESPSWGRPHTEALRAFAAAAAREGFRDAVLLGMGGSSLAPEVLRRSLGVAPGFLDLTVLDSTSPVTVETTLAGRDPRGTLFVVASKSGTTVEVTSLERRCHEWAAAGRRDPGAAFVAITDPGTPLERLARERGYRRVFLNPTDIGGRYSALSLFGLVPAALIGADLEALLGAARAEAEASGPKTRAAENPGLRLGVALAELALEGRDKVTLVPGPPIESLEDWVEQLLAESTGKEGKGLVPIAGESLGPVEAYEKDRVFVSITVGGLPPERARTLEALAAHGHPVLSWSRSAPSDLGAEFLRWEIATAAAGAVLDVNPFDEPNVAEAKSATRELIDRFLATGSLPTPTPIASRGGVEAAAPAPVADALRGRIGDPADPTAWAAALPVLAEPGDYFALLAYLHPAPARHERLQRLRHVVREVTRAATTLGYGPRFLHSTGQLHKGGPNRGLFLQLVGEEGESAIAGERYGFRTLQRAQALGDYRVLADRGRRVLRLDLGADIESGLEALVEAFGARRQS